MSTRYLPASIRSRGKLSIACRVILVAGILYLTLTQLNWNGNSNFKSQIGLAHEKDKGNVIPRKIWQTWHTPATLLAEEDKARVRTWQEKNPYHRYELITDKGADTFVRQHFIDDPLIRDVFLNLTDPILRADFLRYLLLLAEGGVYADVDVECREPIETWVPTSFHGKANVVLGIEADRKPVENDAKLYQDPRDYIWGITNWAFMSTSHHPFLRFVAESVARNLLAIAQKQERNLSTMELSYKEVIDATGPRAFTEAFLAYATKISGRQVTYADATMLEEPKLIDDVLLLPIRAFSTAEADRAGVEGAHSFLWPMVLYHWSAGTWKKTHFQRPEG